MAAVLPFIGPALQIGSGIASGVKGKESQKQANQMGQQALDMYGQMGQSNIDTANYLRGQAEQYSNPALGAQVTENAMGLGGQLMNIAQQGAAGIGAGGFMNQARDLFSGAGNFNQFDFEPVQQTRQQAMAFADQMGTDARRDADAQAALASRNFGSQLDAQLAQRGLSRDSGAAAGALSDFAVQQAMGRSQLESQLAQQAGQLGLQGAQFDVQSGLQLGQMGSQYNLGMNQLGANTGLAQAQGLMALQGMGDQQALQRAGLLSQAQIAGNEAMQQAYAQNYLNPMMNAQNAYGTVGSYQGGYAQQGMQGLTQGAAGAAQTGYGGMGAIGGGVENLGSAIKDKNKDGGGSMPSSNILEKIFGGGA